MLALMDVGWVSIFRNFMSISAGRRANLEVWTGRTETVGAATAVMLRVLGGVGPLGVDSKVMGGILVLEAEIVWWGFGYGLLEALDLVILVCGFGDILDQGP